MDVRITEDGFNSGFLDLRANDIEIDRVDWHADQHHRTAWAHEIENPVIRFGAAASLEHQVRAPSTGDLRHLSCKILFAAIDGGYAAVASYDLELLLHEIADDDATAASRQRRQRHHDADCSRANHYGDVAGRDLCFERRLHPDRERLYQGAFGEADIVGQLVSECLRMDDLRREAAVNRRCRPEGYAWVDVV